VWNNLVSRAFARFWPTLNADTSAAPSSSTPISKKSCQQQQQQLRHQQHDAAQPAAARVELDSSYRFAPSADGSILAEHVQSAVDVNADLPSDAHEPDKQTTVCSQSYLTN
jgi:hypothetical protein